MPAPGGESAVLIDAGMTFVGHCLNFDRNEYIGKDLSSVARLVKMMSD